MQLLSHRGLWQAPQEKNTVTALRSSLERGRGFESDLREYQGRLVISHDIAGEDSPRADEVFGLLRQYRDAYWFAMNIKADGLAGLIREQLEASGVTKAFAFDMSVPQMVEYLDRGFRVFSRQSEYEPRPVLYEKACGVWADAFETDSWITEALLREHLAQKKMLCLVSPELHGRPHRAFWERLRGMDLDFTNILLCTDLSEDAAKFFEEVL